MKLVAILLLLAAAPSQAAGLTIPVGETWLFTIKNGEPAKARKVAPSATVPRGQIKVAVRAMFGTKMTVTNNSPIAYTFQAELISGGKARIEPFLTGLLGIVDTLVNPLASRRSTHVSAPD